MRYEEDLLLTGIKWNQLDEEKKLEILQTIENQVAFESGRSACLVERKFLYTGTNGIVLGSYNHDEKVIYINSSQFDEESMYGKDSQALITTCLHEGRHAYQHQAVEGIVVHENMDEVEEWRENLEHYISFNENPRAYYKQPVEVDARRFGEERYKELVRERESLEVKNSADYNLVKERFVAQMYEKSDVIYADENISIKIS